MDIFGKNNLIEQFRFVGEDTREVFEIVAPLLTTSERRPEIGTVKYETALGGILIISSVRDQITITKCADDTMYLTKIVMDADGARPERITRTTFLKNIEIGEADGEENVDIAEVTGEIFNPATKQMESCDYMNAKLSGTSSMREMLEKAVTCIEKRIYGPKGAVRPATIHSEPAVVEALRNNK